MEAAPVSFRFELIITRTACERRLACMLTSPQSGCTAQGADNHTHRAAVMRDKGRCGCSAEGFVNIGAPQGRAVRFAAAAEAAPVASQSWMGPHCCCTADTAEPNPARFSCGWQRTAVPRCAMCCSCSGVRPTCGTPSSTAMVAGTAPPASVMPMFLANRKQNRCHSAMYSKRNGHVRPV